MTEEAKKAIQLLASFNPGSYTRLERTGLDFQVVIYCESIPKKVVAELVELGYLEKAKNGMDNYWLSDEREKALMVLSDGRYPQNRPYALQGTLHDESFR